MTSKLTSGVSSSSSGNGRAAGNGFGSKPLGSLSAPISRRPRELRKSKPKPASISSGEWFLMWSSVGTIVAVDIPILELEGPRLMIDIAVSCLADFVYEDRTNRSMYE
jgi:hypothetical protein